MATSGSNNVAVQAVGLTKIYGTEGVKVTALDNISVEFKKGHLCAITGPSGSGKSTLLHCLAGLDRPQNGRVLLGDTNLSSLNDRKLTELRRDRIGFVFQAFNLIPTLNARENITLPLEIAGKKVDRVWFKELTGTLGLRGRLKHTPQQLSGGEQQRVAMARALISRPDVIFADEPTGSLDSRNGHELLSLISDAVDRYDQTVILVTHDPNVAAMADRVVFLMDGKFVHELYAPTQESVAATMQSLWGS